MPTAATAPTAPAAADAAPPASAKPPPVDPSSLRGYVRVMGVPQTHQGAGVLTEVTFDPRDEYLADLRFTIAGVHSFRLIVPRALPLPFAKGDKVSFRAGGAGGGPNWRGELILLSANGELLFATKMLPEGWKVERGKRVSTDSGSTSYLEHAHEVRFEHGSSVLSVRPAKNWDRLDDFYIWGSAASRTPKSGVLPPDYVGGWVDYAIVRAR